MSTRVRPADSNMRFLDRFFFHMESRLLRMHKNAALLVCYVHVVLIMFCFLSCLRSHPNQISLLYQRKWKKHTSFNCYSVIY